MNTYDAVPYPGNKYTQTHPDRLATMAILFGMTSAPVNRCRVLELGCGDGGNLIPMAFCLPESRFTGVDLVPSAIKLGEEKAAKLGLTNITLRALDILDFDSSFGEFDYIIAHGVYSWVPPAVRDKILAICRQHLAPQGVAYISYNALPGCHTRLMLREMMLYHTRHIDNTQERLGQARAFAKFLHDSDIKLEPYRSIVRDEGTYINNRTDASLCHDDLSESFQPFYFHEFVSEAARHDLQFLAEAFFNEMYGVAPPNSDAESALTDDKPADDKSEAPNDKRIVAEQYADFLKGRRFRATLLCHAGTRIETTPQVARVRDLYVASSLRPVAPEPDLISETSVAFEGARGEKLETAHPLAKNVFAHLGKFYPLPVAFDELLRLLPASPASSEAASFDEQSLEQTAETLSRILLRSYAANMVEMFTRPPAFVLEASERPCASRLARFEIETGNELSNMRHDTVRVEGRLGARLLSLLDGTRDRPALVREMSLYINELAAQLDCDSKHDDAQNARRMLDDLPDAIEQNLAQLARLGLLVA